jgi:hypothetical protein
MLRVARCMLDVVCLLHVCISGQVAALGALCVLRSVDLFSSSWMEARNVCMSRLVCSQYVAQAGISFEPTPRSFGPEHSRQYDVSEPSMSSPQADRDSDEAIESWNSHTEKKEEL